LRLDFEHREATLHEAVGHEPEEAIDAGEAARVEDRLLRELLATLAARENRCKCCRIIAERSKARRVVAISGAEPVLEILPRLRG